VTPLPPATAEICEDGEVKKLRHACQNAVGKDFESSSKLQFSLF
jgi:hypothetical protein